MEPLNQSKVRHLQDALDLSMTCKKSHISSSSTETWCDLGTADPSPMGFSGVRAEHHISQPCPEISPQDVYAKPVLRTSCNANPRLGSQSRFNRHLPASHFPSAVYNCKAELPKKGNGGGRNCVNSRQEVQHPSSRPQRVDHQNGLNSHVPIPKADGKKAMGPIGHNSHQTNSSTPCVSKTISPSKSYKTAVESSIGTPPKLPLHNVSYRAITLQGHKVNPIHEKVMAKHITEVRHSSSPVCLDSDDSDVIEVPVSNCNKNTPNPQISTSQLLSACADSHESGQFLDSHTNTNTTASTGECGDDAVYVRTNEHSTSGAVAAQSPKPTSSNASSDGSTGDHQRATEANAQSTPKQQQKIESLAKQSKATPGKAPSGAIPPAKRRRKKHRQGPSSASSMFSPQEPEIKLKYASQSQKEEKRDSRADGNFCPYVHMELRESSACTVVNCQEEDEVMQKRRHKRSAPPLRPTQTSGVVPSTSCLRLGRLNADSRGRPMQTCCLCGWPANSMGLGDLHGPYLPSECNRASKQALSSLLDQRDPREVENTESTATSQGYLENSPGNPSKRPRRDWTTDACTDASPGLMVDRDSGEHWVHEDCSIWSAGVFLIKGRLYGLEEVLRLTEETVCSCCHKVGATLGCFFKGCCNKYHYPCALQSDCLLSEDNFSMRCPKHKNKSSRPVTR
ncbi:uncharacterized protein CG5098-like isoform X2 [Clupea harengus]|uniref:Uncharacterized protein CG5098-like isoform X2 n=1 Tax=Clupea harengus TaxID=7950 RepID=A0A6P3WCE2_CLUHA|nr:uncharacterized protein CG5098-like isoform X2 [Clupea harengus]